MQQQYMMPCLTCVLLPWWFYLTFYTCCDFCENTPWGFSITVMPSPNQNSWKSLPGYTKKWIHHLLFTNERFSKLVDSGQKTWCYQVSFYACKSIERRSQDLNFLCGLMLPSIEVPTSYPDPIIFERSSLNEFSHQPSDGLLLASQGLSGCESAHRALDLWAKLSRKSTWILQTETHTDLRWPNFSFLVSSNSHLKRDQCVKISFKNLLKGYILPYV